VGASDAPIICNVSRYLSPFSLYHVKVGALEIERDQPEENEYLYWGKALEPVIIQRFEADTGFIVAVEPPWTSHLDTDDPRLAATLDAVCYDEPTEQWVPLEVKNVSAFFADEWKDEAPIFYQIQCQHQMMVTGAPVAYLCALLGGNRFRWTRIERSDEFISVMREAELAFLGFVEARTPPPVDGSAHTKAVLAKLYPRDTGETVALPAEAIEWDVTREAAKAEIKVLEAAVDFAENRLKAAIGAASVGQLPNGIAFTFRTQHRNAYTVEAADFRVLRRKGGKA
jgi:predicted phage-related endonuclease